MNTETSPRPEPLEITKLRVANAATGARDWVGLAQRIPCQSGTIVRAVSQNFVDQDVLKYKIEAALDYLAPIWSSAEVLRLRKKVVDATGRDPYLLTVPKLRKLAADIGVSLAPKERTVHTMRDAIIRFAAVNPLS